MDNLYNGIEKKMIRVPANIKEIQKIMQRGFEILDVKYVEVDTPSGMFRCYDVTYSEQDIKRETTLNNEEEQVEPSEELSEETNEQKKTRGRQKISLDE